MPIPTKNQMLPFNVSNPGTPLEDAPYNSRLVNHQIHPLDDLPQEENPSNYVLLGFRPGFPLQAAELNEIQENFFLQQSLTTTMMNYWITSGIPGAWGTEADGTVGINFPFGIKGIGNGSEDVPDELAVMGPGWKGTTPLFPFGNPDIDRATNINGSQLVEVTDGNTLTVTFRKGWYLTELRKYQGNSDPVNLDSVKKLQTGFKYWAYLDEDFEVASLPKSRTYTYTVGFDINIKEVSACNNQGGCLPWTSNTPEDDSLNDGSYGEPNINASGADRIRIEFSNARSSHDDIFDGVEGYNGNLSNVLKIDGTREEVRYMNNLLLHYWGETE